VGERIRSGSERYQRGILGGEKRKYGREIVGKKDRLLLKKCLEPGFPSYVDLGRGIRGKTVRRGRDWETKGGVRLILGSHSKKKNKKKGSSEYSLGGTKENGRKAWGSRIYLGEKKKGCEQEHFRD